ncbi:MAG: 3D/G5 domain protein [Candidatus Moranbacteria bacterium GW2011_GWE1_35_17]|nr:MAG: 3D/G5 domain protein [Candidatus Moranbacteria bacterium GW2011_GWE2_35_164]KKP68806.1 MAG: 3D/G5 domain protein [Candidatus Moranbacteria bacterium GW2011_GWE1_35_17]KKP81239.1 MAG: 3D/G5 domain protein [Candidatus Moranbacteria bacterium GW2011_GWF1_35_5]KKP82037.1 MAG: 3D/G5 domain protein [Candidatus Moranbacteria bacterium GW2011_GWF2_35_54]
MVEYNNKKSKLKYIFLLLIILGGFYIGKILFFKDKRVLGIIAGEKNIILDDNGFKNNFKTNSKTVADFLDTQKIILNEKDLIFPDKSTVIYPGSILEIQRAKKLIISVDKERKEIYGFKNTIGEIILENNLAVKEEDIVKPERKTIAYNNEEIKITRVEIKEEVVKKDIDFKTIEKEDDKLSWRTKKVEVTGEKGTKEIRYEVAYYDGKEVSRKIKETVVTKEPVDKVVTQGTYVKLGKSHTGLASWYAHTGTMAAANPWLPMGSYVKVTNKDNGKSVIVKINDRGPFGPNRIIDLDKVAFEKIASLGQGVVNVKMEEISN